MRVGDRYSTTQRLALALFAMLTWIVALGSTGCRKEHEHARVEATDDNVKLSAALDRDSTALTVRLKIENQSSKAIYVFNAMWRLENARQVEDPELLYRIVGDGTLTLLVGIAPLPHSALVDHKNTPDATPIQPGAALSLEYSLPLPIVEHSAYFAYPSPRYNSERTHRVVVAMDYLPHSDDLQFEPSTISPAAVAIEQSEAFGELTRIQTDPVPMDVKVGRRTDWFEGL